LQQAFFFYEILFQFFKLYWGLTAEDYLATRSAVFRMIDPGAMGRFRALFLGQNVPEGTMPVGLTSAFN
jgi:hypothetical protein